MAPTPGGGADRDAAHTFWACAFNMCKAIVGAGMMGLPRAYRSLGSVLGTSLIIIVGGLTYWSMAVLVEGNERHARAQTYPSLARAACGPRVALAVRAAVLLFCFGFAVVYLVVITDVLTGTPPQCNGLICQLTGATGGPLLSRRVVLLVLSCGVAAPLLLLRSIQKLNAFNYLGVAAALLLALIAASLGAAAAARGAAHALPAAPQWADLGGGGGAAGAAEVASIVAVLLACYVGHQNLHPMLPMLRPYTAARMRGVLAVALAMAALVFSVLCIGSALAFGPDLQVNVLSNLSIDAMAPILGPAPAAAASLAIQVGYVVSLMASLLLYMHPLRSSTAEMIWREPERGDAAHAHGRAHSAPAGGGGTGGGGGPEGGAGGEAGAGAAGGGGGGEGGGGGGRAAEMEARHYYLLTYSLLAAATLAAISVPNIWAALSVIGNMCASVEAFIAPGCIALALRGLWPGGNGGGGGGGGEGGGAEPDAEAAPLLLDGPDPAAGGGGGRGARGAARKAGAGRGERLLYWGDVSVAALAIALGAGLLFNGVLQQLLAFR